MTIPLLLDTGATTTLVKEGVLASLGYDPSNPIDQVTMTPGASLRECRESS
jgi:hypothetical protein